MIPGNGDEEQRNFQSREDSESAENRREGDSEGQQESRYGRYNSESGERQQRPRISTYNSSYQRRPSYSRDGGQWNQSRPSYGSSRPQYGSSRSENSDGESNGYTPRYQSAGQRPRFNRYQSSDGQQQSRYGSDQYGERRQNDGERPSYSREDGEGQMRPQRPRFNQSYGNNSYGERQQRPRFNSNGRYGNNNYGNNNQGGYQQRPRYNNNNNRNGGYQQGGQRQRFGGNGGGNNRFGGNQQRGNKQQQRQQKVAMDANLFLEPEQLSPEVQASAPQPSTKMRLNRFISISGVCSRREADELIKRGDIKVNGKVITEMGVTLNKGDVVEYEGRVLKAEKKVYVLLNKPKDTVTTMDDPEERHTVMDLVEDAGEERIYPVGRLDRNTTGVLLLTNDGELAEKLTHPRYEVRKIYHVYLDKNVEERDMQQMLYGIMLEDGPIRVDDVRYVDPNDRKQVGVQIHSGRNRIVRRIFESLGYNVEKLDRVYFAGLTKLNLPRGRWRYLNDTEITKLKAGFFK